MTIPDAIEKAIEGGYTPAKLMGEIYNEHNQPTVDSYFLDPDFWKCLGKAMGWEGGKIRMCVGCGVALRWNENPTVYGKHGGNKGCGSDILEYEGQWLIEWHRFIDAIAEGRPASEFFEELK